MTVTETPSEDLHALEALFDAYHRQAIGLAYRLLGDRDEAEDVVQDAFISVWRALDRYDPARGSRRTWLLSIVRNRALDVLRSRRVHRVEPLGDDSLWADGSDVARLVEVLIDGGQAHGAVAQLPHAQRRTIELAYFGGLTQTEIAAELALPLGTIKGRVRLGLQRLRTVLGAQPTVSVAHAG